MIDVDESLAPITSSRIYDVHGRIVVESERERVLNIQTLAEGIYSIVVTTPAGQWVGSVVVGR